MSDLVAVAYDSVATARQVADNVSADKVIPQIKVPGTIIQTSLDNESEQRLATALAAAGEN